MWTPCYFVKWTDFFALASTWTVQNLLENADTGMPLAQDCSAPLIDSPTGHYTSTGTPSYSKGELWNMPL